MKYLNLESSISPEKERDEIVKFLDKYWNVKVRPGKSLGEAIDYVLQEGINSGIAWQEKKSQELVEDYNTLANWANEAGGNVSVIDFERTTTDEDVARYNNPFKRLESVLRKNWLFSAQPKGYKKFKRTHEAIPQAYDEDLEFFGSGLHSSLRSSCPGFADSLEKGFVYYSEKEQDRSPVNELAGAIYRQGMTIGIQMVEQKWGTPSEIYKKISETRKLSRVLILREQSDSD